MIDKFALLFSVTGVLVTLWLMFTNTDWSKDNKKSDVKGKKR
ncbi:hypothetical protein [Vibrio sp. qd031]|nr:hypothetical protein [Vibrio sp. qd031]